MLRKCALVTLIFAASWAAANPVAITVDCGAGQSLNGTLAKMNKLVPATVTIKGTCTEFVIVDGFNELTLNGAPGAALQQPDTNPQSYAYLLSIHNSQGVTVSGLAIHSLSTIFSGIGVGGGSHAVQLQGLSMDGAWGVVVYEASQVGLKNVTVNLTFGYAAVAVYDKSDVHIVNGVFERPADSNWHAGLTVGSGHVTMQGTVIRDMQTSIVIGQSGSVDLVYFDSSVPYRDVTINNPAGNNYTGVRVGDGSSLNLESVKLRITNAGQASGYDNAAVFVTDGSTLNAGANLVVSGSQNQGVLVANNSHAVLAGSSITGSGHGGLVAVNLSTIAVTVSTSPTVVGGNATDLFCDSKSQIAGSLNISNANRVQCTNLLPGDYESLP